MVKQSERVVVNTALCKGCDLCVSLCPAGVLSMEEDGEKLLGKVASVLFIDACIGCKECEIHCPDFAISVADKDSVKFAKLSSEAKDRAKKIVANKFFYPNSKAEVCS